MRTTHCQTRIACFSHVIVRKTSPENLNCGLASVSFTDISKFADVKYIYESLNHTLSKHLSKMCRYERVYTLRQSALSYQVTLFTFKLRFNYMMGCICNQHK